MVTSIVSPGGGGIDVCHVCHYFRVSGHKSFVYIHTPISQEVETARRNMFGNTAHDVHVLWMQKFGFPSLHAHLISRPPSNVPTRHIRIHAIGNQRFACDESFLYAVHVAFALNRIGAVG